MTGTPDEVVDLHAAASAALDGGRHDEARHAFEVASRVAAEHLPPTDATRLALAGAHADAWFEHWDDIEQAFRIAHTAYEDAIEEIDDTTGEPRRAAVRELSALRDRLTFWAFTMS